MNWHSHVTAKGAILGHGILYIVTLYRSSLVIVRKLVFTLNLRKSGFNLTKPQPNTKIARTKSCF